MTAQQPNTMQNVRDVLIANPMTEFTVAKLAEMVDATDNSVAHALARGYEINNYGWQFVHKSVRRRPTLWWYDQSADRTPVPDEPVAPAEETLTVITAQDGRLLLKAADGSLWIATPFRLGLDS
jgi:hypothetical protein